jgi:hypothetical protein
MKIWLGLLSVLLSFSASAADSNYKQLDASNSRVNEQTSPKMSWGDADRLKATTKSMYMYKDKGGQVLLTNVNPSVDLDKFTKKVKVTYYEDTIEKERKWKRQLVEKPAARIGMSQKQILNNTNWGEPKNTSTTIDASGTSEQWIYNSTHSLYFKNGKLIKIEK